MSTINKSTSSVATVAVRDGEESLNAYVIGWVESEKSTKVRNQTLTWDELRCLFQTPHVGPKKGPAFVPSEMTDGERRRKQFERTRSLFVLDIDGLKAVDPNNSIKTPEITVMADRLRSHGLAAYLYTTYSHKTTAHRYRIIMPLSFPWRLDEESRYDALKNAGWLVANQLQIDKFVDEGSFDPARCFYFPRVRDQQAKHEFQFHAVEGKTLTLPEFRELMPRHNRPVESPMHSDGIIDQFNRTHRVQDLLEKHGYKQLGTDRWLSPTSETGQAGVVLLEGDDGKSRIYSHHSTDALNCGNALDAFDIFRILEHQDDQEAAIQAAMRLYNYPHVYQGSQAASVMADSWETPLPIKSEIESKPYPVEAFPVEIQAAVKEVQLFMQSPVALVGTSALSALSVAVQGLVNIERAPGLDGPTSLYTLVIAESGERKTATDRHFWLGIDEYELESKSNARDETATYETACENRDRRLSVCDKHVRSLLQRRGSNSEDIQALEDEILELKQQVILPPLVPKIQLTDETPENLAFSLAKHYPSAAVMTSEGGHFFGAHGMKAEHITKNLALYNTLWDGRRHRIGRRTSEDIALESVRLTLTLQTQNAVLSKFLLQSGDLARGSGFLARFLITRPESTQGQRFYKDPPRDWPRRQKFSNRIKELLELGIQVDENRQLELGCLQLSAEGKRAWVEYHDQIESDLSRNGAYDSIRDVASKAADNIARIATIFHVYENGPEGEVSDGSVHRAAEFVAWHLEEALRFYNEIQSSTIERDAIEIEYILKQKTKAQGSVSVRDILNGGPRRLRSRHKLDPVLEFLAERHRVKVRREGKSHMIELNPALRRDTNAPVSSSSLNTNQAANSDTCDGDALDENE